MFAKDMTNEDLDLRIEHLENDLLVIQMGFEYEEDDIREMAENAVLNALVRLYEEKMERESR